MPYHRDSLSPDENNLTVLPSRFGNKRARVESTFLKPFLRSKIPSLTPQHLEQPRNTSRDFALEFESTHLAPVMSLPVRTSLNLNSQLSSSQISSKLTFKSDVNEKDGLSLCLGSSSKVDSNIISEDQLSRQSTFESTASSKLYQSEAETHSLSNNLSLKVEPEFLPSSQLSIDPKTSLFRTKSQSKKGEELDTWLSLGSSQSSSLSLGIHTHTSQLITPVKHTFDHIYELRQQARSARATIGAAQRKVSAQARIECLRRERLLKEHLERKRVSSTDAEDLLSQWVRMGRFSVQAAETREFREKRSRQSSWTRNQIKEETLKRSLGKESDQSGNSWTRYLSTNKSRRSKTTGIQQMEKMKELGEVKSIPKEPEHSLKLSSWPNLQQHIWSPKEIDLSLGLQMPSTSTQVAEIPKTATFASFQHK